MKRHSQFIYLIVSTFVMVICSIAYPGIVLSNDSRPAIEYAYPDQSIWTTKRDAEGILKNPLLHVAEAMFSELQIGWTARPYPANRMFDRLQEGKSNFSILVQASRLKESCIFSKKAVTYSELRVYKRPGAPPITKIEDFKGKQVITIRGYSYGKIGKFLKDTINQVITFEAPQHESAFTMLSHARADYLLDYSGPSDEVLQSQPIPGVSYDVLTRLDVFLVLSKNYPNALSMMNSMENTFQNIDVTQWGLKRP